MKDQSKPKFLNTTELIKHCKQNNYKAQLEVYNLFKNLLFNVSFRILKQREEAEDIVQEAFIHGFKKIDQLQDDGNIGAWFRRIAVNKSLDKIRKEKNITWLDQQVEVSVEEEETLENSLNISVDFVKKCINQLKEKYRLVVTLYMIEDYSHKEIAEILQVNESTIRNQYKRGKDKLLTLLK